jgi:hypothetical protein
MGPKRTLVYCLLGLFSTASIVLARAGTARADISVGPPPEFAFAALAMVVVLAMGIGAFFLLRHLRRKRGSR